MKKITKTESLLKLIIITLNKKKPDTILNQEKLYEFFILFSKNQINDSYKIMENNFYIYFDFKIDRVVFSYNLVNDIMYGVNLNILLKDNILFKNFLETKNDEDFSLLIKEVIRLYSENINKLYQRMCMPESNADDFIDNMIRIADLNPEGQKELLTPLEASLSPFGYSNYSFYDMSKRLTKNETHDFIRIITPLFLGINQEEAIREIIALKNNDIINSFLNQEDLMNNVTIMISLLDNLSRLSDDEIFISDSIKEKIESILITKKYLIKTADKILNLSYSQNDCTKKLINKFYETAKIAYKNNIEFFIFKKDKLNQKNGHLLSKQSDYYYTKFCTDKSFIFSDNFNANYRGLFSDNKADIDLLLYRLSLQFDNIFISKTSWYLFSKYYEEKFHDNLNIRQLRIISQNTDPKIINLMHHQDAHHEYLLLNDAQTIKE